MPKELSDSRGGAKLANRVAVDVTLYESLVLSCVYFVCVNLSVRMKIIKSNQLIGNK